jgi:hypothetical protein
MSVQRDAAPSSRSAIAERVSPRRTVIIRWCPSLRIIVKIRNLQSPANLQPIRPTGQHRRIRRRDLAPISAISVVPLSQAPQIVARLHHVVMPVVIDSLCSWSSRPLAA